MGNLPATNLSKQNRRKGFFVVFKRWAVRKAKIRPERLKKRSTRVCVGGGGCSLLSHFCITAINYFVMFASHLEIYKSYWLIVRLYVARVYTILLWLTTMINLKKGDTIEQVLKSFETSTCLPISRKNCIS